MNIIDILPLYNNPLYVMPYTSNNIKFSYGNFEQKLMAVMHIKEKNDENLNFLESIFQSFKKNSNEYLILADDNSDILLQQINHKHPTHVFVFNIDKHLEHFQFKKSKYKPFTFNNIIYILCDSVNDIRIDKEKKMQLWNNAIKPLFVTK